VARRFIEDREELTHDVIPAGQPYPYTEALYTFDYEAFVDQLTDPYSGTCTWISGTAAFKAWVAGTQSRVYWIHGPPGLGKSVIAKYLLQTVIKSLTMEEIGFVRLYFFCSYRDTASRSVSSLLSSLIHQLLDKMPTLPISDAKKGNSRLRNMYGQYVAPDVNSVNFLLPVFTELIQDFTRRYPSDVANFYIVIDAVDELDESQWATLFNLVDIIDSNSTWVPKTRILITSRTEPAIKKELIGKHSLDLSSLASNTADVAKYVRGTVSDYGQENSFGHGRTENIISEIITRSEGMFLWASLAWALFIEGVGMWTKSLVIERLQGLRQIPPGMQSLYHRIFSSVKTSYVPELSAALRWIVAAPRPMTVDEMAIALALRDRARQHRLLEIRFNVHTFLKRHCPHLIKIDDNGAIRLLHLSVKSYLTETKVIYNETGMMDNNFYITLDKTNYDIGIDCLSYLTLDDFIHEPLEDMRLQKFFSYAHEYWTHHLAGNNERTHVFLPYVLRLLDTNTRSFTWYDTSRILFELYDCKLWRLFKPLAQFGININVKNSDGDHIIHRIINDNLQFPSDMLRWFIDIGLNINGTSSLGQSILHRHITKWHDHLWKHVDNLVLSERTILPSTETDLEATEHESNALESIQKACTELLSYPQIDTNVVDVFGFTPLSYAINWGMTDAMELLLACPYFEAQSGGNALNIAVKEGVFGAVKVLVERGVDVSTTNQQGATVLHVAAEKGHFKILKLLYAHCTTAILNAQDSSGWTVAHRATISGNDDLVTWMINCSDVDLTTTDMHGRLAISFAAAFGSQAMLAAFLAHNPRQLHHTDWFGNTLLHRAAFGGNRQNFHYLLSLRDCPAPGLNKWGKTVADLAPTVGMDQYLHVMGYRHSHACNALCLVRLKQQQQHVVEPDCWLETDSSVSLIRLKLEDDGEYSIAVDSTEWASNSGDDADDTLGLRFGKPTYYAVG
jgi:ankyrin repeat protein